ncbi:MAG: RNA-guided endonuclease InsQ/TnpB family protein [Methanosarcina sp.]
MRRGNLYRIYPTEIQKPILEQHFGANRFVYNKLLHVKSTIYKQCKCSVSRIKLNDYIIVLKDIYPWLKNINSQALQSANVNLDNAYQRFFKGLGDYPTEKTKKKKHFSFQVPQHYKINLTTSEIFLPIVGWIKINIHRQFFEPEFFETNIKTTTTKNGIIIEKDLNSEFLRTVTISRTSAGRYHVSILTEDLKTYPLTQQYSESMLVGVDVGIKTFAACSNGKKIDNPKFLKKSLKKLKMLQRRVSRKVKGSKRRKKTVKKLAKQHQLVANQRHDFQHKVSLSLIRENQAVAIETLNIKGMQKNHKLAQAVSDSAWYSFVQKLMYKAERYGKTILKIGQWEPSSKQCNVCGYINKELTLKDREWLCPSCNTNHDRDINAAINIKQFAINNLITSGTEGRARGVIPVGEGYETRCPSLQ